MDSEFPHFDLFSYKVGRQGIPGLKMQHGSQPCGNGYTHRRQSVKLSREQSRGLLHTLEKHTVDIIPAFYYPGPVDSRRHGLHAGEGPHMLQIRRIPVYR